ncbi:MAG TPA: hypothetical protein VK498_16175 [Ferruginibacter sp.]|nr:hypothetical protein [Ferruginibacter sp.]
MTTTLNTACSDHRNIKVDELKKEGNNLLPAKPGSGYRDTIIIDFQAAVFYSPDSLQLKKIKAITDSGVFDGMMHEYYYLSRNAHFAIKKINPAIKIMEVNRSRFVLFVKADKSTHCIDLDTKKEPYGLFLFNLQNPPKQADMANIESELGFYFSN